MATRTEQFSIYSFEGQAMLPSRKPGERSALLLQAARHWRRMIRDEQSLLKTRPDDVVARKNLERARASVRDVIAVHRQARGGL